MAHKKPVPAVAESTNRICPICGKPSYSPGGIHPQCAMVKADTPRTERLKAQQKEKAKEKTSEPRTWKKKCPKCRNEVHVRRKLCDCGHEFLQKVAK